MTDYARGDGVALLKGLLEVAHGEQRSSRVNHGRQAVESWAETLTALPEFTEAAAAVSEAGGRPLDARSLVRTGVAAMLAMQEDLDAGKVAEQLWHYLTRTVTPYWEALALDIDALPDDVEVGGWVTWNPDEVELAAFAPVPAAAAHRIHDPWPVAVVTEHALLRRRGEDRRPAGLWLRLRRRRLELDAAWPLTILNLYSAAVVRGMAMFDIWQHDQILRHGDGVVGEYEPSDPHDPNGTWRFRAYTGRFEVHDEPAFRRFCRAVDDLRSALCGEGCAANLLARFDRAVNHYVLANCDSQEDGTAEADVEPDVLLRYVICLETLLSPKGRQELTRTVSQRAAVLVRGHGADARRLEGLVRDAYRARSKHVHGDEPGSVDLPELRLVVGGVLLRWLAAAGAHARRSSQAHHRANRTQEQFEDELDAMVIDPNRWATFADAPWKSFEAGL